MYTYKLCFSPSIVPVGLLWNLKVAWVCGRRQKERESLEKGDWKKEEGTGQRGEGEGTCSLLTHFSVSPPSFPLSFSRLPCRLFKRNIVIVLIEDALYSWPLTTSISSSLSDKGNKRDGSLYAAQVGVEGNFPDKLLLTYSISNHCSVWVKYLV